MTMTAHLTARQAAFVREYLVSRNQTEAFIKADYSAKTARVNAARMMANDNIRAAIAEGETASAERARVTLDDIVAQYIALGMTGMSRFVRIDDRGQPVVDLANCTPTDIDSLSEITIDTFVSGQGEEVRRIRLKRHDRYTALAKLATYLGLDRGINGDSPSTNPLDELLRQIQERHTALPVKPQGPLGAKRLPSKH